ncbi:MAG: glutamine-hydrolyzing GMP synthase [Deltaproteobacteria bacterium]|nr:glutamine-hydrolyzing GMP synthase [Deltaproteobacteria bacterium]
MKHDRIAVVDFGGQYAHLIATKVRRLKVLAEIRQPEDPIGMFEGYRGIILSGSPALSSHGEEQDYNKAIYDLDVPMIGFCFGHQEIAKHYGGEVVNAGQEWGPADLKIIGDSPIFDGLGPTERVWMSHNDTVASLGPDFVELGYTALGAGGREHRFAAIGSDKLRRYGFQFHPEVDDTVHGDRMIANFVLGICGCRPSWTMDAYLRQQEEKVRRQVGDRSVFLLASGGVDSTVAARVLQRALGPERLHLLHVDNGLMRKDESRKVLDLFRQWGLGEGLHFVDATGDFLSALEGVVEPERKRAVIGATFIEVFEREASRLGIEGHLLGQGTIYPDTIETGGTKRADTIKTHHNRVPVIERMIAEGRVVEPLADLYKVEVRELGEMLGIPREAIWRHPFPGPGLGVRLLCSDGEAVGDLSGISAAAASIGDRYDLDTAVLPIRSVGVKADLRSYEHPVLLSGEADWDRLVEAAGTIFKEVTGVNRAIWNLGPGSPTAFRTLAATMTRDRLDLLREADHMVMEGLKRHGLYDAIWQCPTAMVPLEVDGHGREFVIVRPIHSERAMTATPASLPPALLDELRREILALDGISGLALDLTTKPPGTIEWE